MKNLFSIARTIFVVGIGVIFLLMVVGASSGFAVDTESSNYRIEGGVVGGFGGNTSSSSYELTSTAGQAFTGRGSSVSYSFNAGYIARLERSISLAVDEDNVLFNPSVGASSIKTSTVSVQTDGGGYQLSIMQNHDLSSGLSTIPAISGTIASPQAWNEGVTQGFGFSVTTGSSVPPKWSDAYAAIPNSSTIFYLKEGYQTTWDDTVLTYRLSIGAAQDPGTYQNEVTYTALALL